MPGFPLSVTAPFGLCGRMLSLAPISAALSPHPKIPFLADKAQQLTSDFCRTGARPRRRWQRPVFWRALLLRIQPKRFELATPLRRKIAQPRVVDSWASARLVGSSAAGVIIAAMRPESPPISQTFQRPDSIRRSLSAHRLRALHGHRTHLRPIQPVDQREQLRMVQPHPGRRNLRPAELRLLKRLGKQAQNEGGCRSLARLPIHRTIGTYRQSIRIDA